jgi:hypothetical protein
MLHRFEIDGRRLALYQRSGESFEHVALKALCYTLYASRYDDLGIETRLGWRYTPDVVSLDGDGRPRFWGECGSVSLRKVAWLAKHSGAAELAFVKLGGGAGFAAEVRGAVEERYRPPGRVVVIGVREHVPGLLQSLGLRADAVPGDWYRRIPV